MSHILGTKILPKNFPCFGVKIFIDSGLGGSASLRSLAYVHLLGLKSFLTFYRTFWASVAGSKNKIWYPI